MSMLTGLVAEDDRGMRRGGRVRVALVTGDESFVQQSFQDETDINLLMKRYERDGAAAWLLKYADRLNAGQYMDVSDVPDYHDAQNAVVTAEKMFLDLPAKVRDRFKNDPGQFLEFATDPSNVDELVKMGLATKVHKPGELIETPPPKREEPPVPPK